MLERAATGFVHIGGVYVATIDRDIAAHSGGVYLVRVEDTDQSREVKGALAQFARAFEYFGIPSDEDDARGDYGPYRQSARAPIYLSYARELLRQGTAYLCFATKDELADITARQQAAKIPTGYYEPWALWRDADPAAVRAKLAEGAPYVVRFRAPGNAAGQRIHFTDAIRGELAHEANRNDTVILKSSDQSPRLPTYHFAHAGACPPSAASCPDHHRAREDSRSSYWCATADTPAWPACPPAPRWPRSAPTAARPSPRSAHPAPRSAYPAQPRT